MPTRRSGYRSSAICLGTCGWLILSGIVGCGSKAVPIGSNLVGNAGFEEPLDSDGIPKGWSLSTTSAGYKCIATDTAHSGKRAVTLAGSGVTAEIRTNPFKAAGPGLLECEAWLQVQLIKNAQSSVFVEFPHAEAPLLIRVNSKVSDWQRVRYLQSVGPKTVVEGSLAVRLAGEALVRVDDLSAKLVTDLIQSEVISDPGFERPDPSGAFPEWKHVTNSKTNTCEELSDSPHSGKHYVSLRGTGGWAVLVTTRGIAPSSKRIIVQGFVRVRHGKGQMKIDYIKDDNCFESTFSAEGTADWTFVMVEADPALAEQSDLLRIAIGASGGEGKFEADYDDLEVFLQE